MVEYMIHSAFDDDGRQINIMWQAMAYVLIGAGEIFAISAAYEVAFTAAPPEKKVLASATNLVSAVPVLRVVLSSGLFFPYISLSSGNSSASVVCPM
jgi:proton-dependent oligopeptide transporter, POT family